MSFTLRDVQFDVVAVAGPRLPLWPSTGARALATFCGKMGLTTGWIGGEQLTARGVLPLPNTGGILLADDLQKRIHRIRARAIIRFSARHEMPDPFSGWISPGLIPLSTAQQYQNKTQILWHPAVAILGSGNRAFRFGSYLLNQGVPKVYCIETRGTWGAKDFAGWEVERRNFENLGGDFINGKPMSLKPQTAQLWELTVQMGSQFQSLIISRVVSAGPFNKDFGVKEFPPGSLLFEIEQTAPREKEEDFEGWFLEEERCHLLATKISKALVAKLGPKREKLQKAYRRSKARLKQSESHREHPFQPVYQGKWMETSVAKKIRSFTGVPQKIYHTKPIASVECFEEIPCDLCVKSCPESAIEVSQKGVKALIEKNCTACGLCLTTCPTQSISLIYEKEGFSTAWLSFSWSGVLPWKVGEFADLINRKGDRLGSGRIIATTESALSLENKKQLVKVEIPSHLIWEARGLKVKTPIESSEVVYRTYFEDEATDKVEVYLNGEKRLIRDGISVLMGLVEMGRNRPDDIFVCKDGSCGLCSLLVDGVKKLACQSVIRKGMSINHLNFKFRGNEKDNEKLILCPCLGIEREEVIDKIIQGKLTSPEAVLIATRVGEGRCHGQLCMEPFKRVLLERSLDVSKWIDWRFPWSDWQLTPREHK